MWKEPGSRSWRAAVIAYEMEGAVTGVGRYLEGLLGGLAECDSDWEWLLFFKGVPFRHRLWDRPDFKPVFAESRASSTVLWEQLRLPLLLRNFEFDLLFSPGYSLPANPGVPSLVTIHDLSFEHLPEEFSWRERWRRRVLARRAARRARRVFADSQSTADRLQQAYKLDPARIGVVPLAVDQKFLRQPTHSQDSDESLLVSLGIRLPYLLYAGTILPRRNVELLIDVFSRLAPEFPKLTLVLAGANRLPRPADLEDWVVRSGLGERLIRLGYVNDELLSALYRNAEVSFYLSPYEGFGFPPLESLASGTPALVAAGLGLDEIWPAYPYRCEILNLESVERLTRRVLQQPAERNAVGDEAIERMSLLTWKRSAELFLLEVGKALAR